MPTNFNQTLDTSTPNIPSYGDAGGQVAGYDIGTGLASIAEVFKSFAEQKAANQKATTIAGVADAFLGKRQEMLDGLSDIQTQQNDLLSNLNPQDAASVKEFQTRMNTLNAQSRQLRRDNSASILALTRQSIAQNPHLTEEIISASKGSEDLFSNVFVESDSSGFIDEKDARVKYVSAVQDLALASGGSIKFAQAVLANDAALRDLDAKSKGARLKAEPLVGFGVLYASTVAESLVQTVTISHNKSNFESPEAAEADSYRQWNMAFKKVNNWIIEQQANGVVFQQDELDTILGVMNRQLAPIKEYARNLHGKPITSKENDLDSAFILAAASAYTADNNPYMASVVRADPKGYMKKYGDPMIKVVQTLRGVDFVALQKTANGTGPDAADARSKLYALKQYTRIEQAKVELALGSEEGKTMLADYATMIESINNNTFDVTKVPKGTVSEMLMVEGVFNASQNNPTPEENKAARDIVMDNYAQDANTMRRLLEAPVFVKQLNSDKPQRIVLVSQIQKDLEGFATEKNSLLNEATIDRSVLSAKDWRSDKPLFTLKPVYSGTKTSQSINAQNSRELEILNMRWRLLLRWSDSPQEAVTWFNENVMAARQKTLSDLITGSAGGKK